LQRCKAFFVAGDVLEASRIQVFSARAGPCKTADVYLLEETS
jgi:hypothetical protein